MLIHAFLGARLSSIKGEGTLLCASAVGPEGKPKVGPNSMSHTYDDTRIGDWSIKQYKRTLKIRIDTQMIKQYEHKHNEY